MLCVLCCAAGGGDSIYSLVYITATTPFHTPLSLMFPLRFQLGGFPRALLARSSSLIHQARCPLMLHSDNNSAKKNNDLLKRKKVVTCQSSYLNYRR